MDKTLLEILGSLEPMGLGGPNNIAPIINKRFEMFNDEKYFQIQRDSILTFLRSIDGDIRFYNDDIDSQISKFNVDSMPEKWLNSEMRVALLRKGIDSLNNERDRILIRDTNEKNINIAKSQAIISRWQMWIFLATAVFILGQSIISGFNWFEEKSKNKSQKQLQQQLKELSSLHFQLSQLKNDTSRLSKEVLDLTKNNGDGNSKRSPQKK